MEFSAAVSRDQFIPPMGTSGACCRDQFIPLPGFIWSLLPGPVHPSSGVHLKPADGISSTLFWGSSGACWLDQFIPLLGIIWSLLTGPVLPSSGVCLEPADRSGHPSSEVRLEPADRTSSSLFWGSSGACWQDQFFPLLGFVWSLLTGPVIPLQRFVWSLLTGPVHTLFWSSSGACWQVRFIPLLGSIWVGPDRRLELYLQCLPFTTTIHPSWKADPIRVSSVCHPHTDYNSDSKLIPILIIIFWFWHSNSVTVTQFRLSKSVILIPFYAYLFQVSRFWLEFLFF